MVTVSRQFGAGGRSFSEAVARELGYRLVDREIVEQAAARAGIDPEVAEEMDERTPSLIEEVGLALAAATPELGLEAARMDDRVLADAVRKVVEALAETGGYVILGRGAQAILRDRPRACHVQLVGELADRAQLIVQRQGLSLKEAKDRCRQVDDDRAAYLRRFYGVDINDPLLYDAILNTSKLSIEGAAVDALGIIRRRLAG